MAVISAKKMLPGNKSGEPAENTLGVRQCKLYLATNVAVDHIQVPHTQLNLKDMQYIENVWSIINRSLRYTFNYLFLSIHLESREKF